MNKKIVSIAMFTIGSILGFFVGKKVYEGYYAGLAQEEIDSVKETFSRSETKGVDRGLGRIYDKKDDISDEEQPSQDISGPVRSSLYENAVERAKRNYNLVGIKTKTDEKENDEDEEEDDAGMTEEEMNPDIYPPYIISPEEFSEEYNDYEKISLYYYLLDDELFDEDDHPVDNPEVLFGSEIAESLGTDEMLCVRNDQLRIDYEVVKVWVKDVQESPKKEKTLSPREKYERDQKRRNVDG